MNRSLPERALEACTWLFSGTLLGLASLPSGTDQSGDLSLVTEISVLGLLAALPVGAALALSHTPHVLSNASFGSYKTKVLWLLAIYAAFPVAGPAYWLTDRHRGIESPGGGIG